MDTEHIQLAHGGGGDRTTELSELVIEAGGGGWAGLQPRRRWRRVGLNSPGQISGLPWRKRVSPSLRQIPCRGRFHPNEILADIYRDRSDESTCRTPSATRFASHESPAALHTSCAA